MSRGRAFEGVWYTQALLRELVLIYPTAAIMMQEQGVSAVSLALLFMIWSGAAVAFEIPTGVLADRMSRRNVLAASAAIEGLGFAVWWLAPTFWGFAAGFVLWGLGSALRSGASEAFLHDSLVAQGRSEHFERVYGWGQGAGTFGAAVALFLGGWVAGSGYGLPLVLSVLAPWSAAVLTVVVLREPPASASAVSERPWQTLAAGCREIVGRQRMLLLVLMIALLPMVYEVVDEFVGPLFAELEFSLTGVGVVYGLAFLVRSVSVLGAYRLRALEPGRVCALFSAGAVVLMAGVLNGGLLAVAGLCGFFALSGIADVLLQSRLQRTIEGRARATITSVAGLLQELSSLALYLAIGVAAQWLGWQTAVAAAGVWLLVTAAAFAVASAMGQRYPAAST